MKLRPDQLTSHLRQGLKPLYLVSGDEPLLVQETLDSIRQSAREQGVTEREILHIDKGFDWGAFTLSANTLSLFGDRRLIELRFTGKPDAAAATALTDYASNPPPDNILLIIFPKLDAGAQKAAWYSQCDTAGVCIILYPLEASAFPDWLKARLRQRGLEADTDALRLLIESTEGNLLAAAQEIDKLSLLHEKGALSFDAVQQAIGHSARYDVFELCDTVMQGHTEKALRILNNLLNEGEAETVILWTLLKDIRALLGAAALVEKGSPVNAALAQQGVWQKRQPLLATALKRLPLRHLEALLLLALEIDRGVKGRGEMTSTDGLVRLVAALSGAPILRG